jgi:hypothetical protein
MTVDELIQDLEEARDELGGDAEIRVAYQPSWPLRTTIARVTIPQDDRPGDDEDEIAEVDEKDAGSAGSRLPKASRTTKTRTRRSGRGKGNRHGEQEAHRLGDRHPR